MYKLLFIFVLFLSQNVFAQSLEQRSVNLLKSFIPKGKNTFQLRGVFWNTNEPCYLAIAHYLIPATPQTPVREDVSVTLSSIKYQRFAKFDVGASIPQPTNTKVVEFTDNQNQAHIVRLAKENNQYAPIERATLDLLKGPQNTIKGLYILVQYGQTKHSELRCKFQ